MAESFSGQLPGGLPLPVDTHVHLSLGGSFAANAEAQFAAGVALLRDAGDRDGCLSGCRAEPGPEIIRSGPALFKKGAYGAFLGDNRELSLAAKIAAAPEGFVKLIITGLVSFDVYGEVGPRQWSREEIGEIVDLAAAAGKKVMAHVNSDAACRDAVAAGVDSLEHAYFIAPETLLQMVATGVSWAPTVAAMANQLADPAGRFSPGQLAVIERNYRRHLEMIHFAWENGVRLTIGTDSGSYNVPHGPSFLREMELFLEAGIPLPEVWRIATVNGRELLGRSLEPLIYPEPELGLDELLACSRRYLQKAGRSRAGEHQAPAFLKTD